MNLYIYRLWPQTGRTHQLRIHCSQVHRQIIRLVNVCIYK